MVKRKFIDRWCFSDKAEPEFFKTLYLIQFNGPLRYLNDHFFPHLTAIVRHNTEFILDPGKKFSQGVHSAKKKKKGYIRVGL